MHVIIAGGTGLIGRALARSLVADGHPVTVLTRRPEARSQGLPGEVQLVAWDGQTVGEWAQALEGADGVVNLAGAGLAEQRWTAERKRIIRESRIRAGEALAQAVEQASPRPEVFVQASAVGYYGPCGDEIVTEEHPPGTDFLAQLCVEWEASSARVEALGLRRPILRTGVVLSREGGALPRMVLPVRLFVGGPLGSGRQYFPWIHIADEVRAIRFLLEQEGASGPYNLTAPNPVTNREFIRLLGRVLGRPTVLPVPALALRLLFGEMATVLLDGQRAVPQRLLEAGFAFRFTQAEEALRDLLGKGQQAVASQAKEST